MRPKDFHLHLNLHSKRARDTFIAFSCPMIIYIAYTWNSSRNVHVVSVLFLIHSVYILLGVLFIYIISSVLTYTHFQKLDRTKKLNLYSCVCVCNKTAGKAYSNNIIRVIFVPNVILCDLVHKVQARMF